MASGGLTLVVGLAVSSLIHALEQIIALFLRHVVRKDDDTTMRIIGRVLKGFSEERIVAHAYKYMNNPTESRD